MGAGLAALGSFILIWHASPSALLRWKFSWSPALLGILLIGLLLTVMVTLIAVKFSFHDQMRIQSHPSLIETMLRGNFPPHLIVFPDIPLKYHWGADLFGSIMSYVTGLPGHRAIDLTQALGWILFLGCIYTCCREAGLTEKWTLLALIWIPLGAGWAYLIQNHLASPAQLAQLNFDWPDSKMAFGRHLNPGTISNFFMTPSSLGMPLLFAYLILFFQWVRKRNSRLWILMSILLGGLSLIQVAYFATLLSTSLLCLGILTLLKKRSWGDFLKQSLILTAIASALAFALGGFFVRAGGYSPDLLIFNWPPGYLTYEPWARGVPITWTQSFLWYLATFGSLIFLSLPCTALALRSLRRDFNPPLLFLLIFSWQSFTVAQFFHYKLTWDIIKWFTSFHITMLLLIVLVASQWKRKWLTVLLAGMMLLDIVPSLRYLSSLAFLSPEQVAPKKRAWWEVVIPYPGEAMSELVKQLKARPWKEMVLSDANTSSLISIYSGQSEAMVDINTIYFGVEPARIRERNQLIAAVKQEFRWEELEKSPIRWLVFPCRDLGKVYSEPTQNSLQQALREGRLSQQTFSDAVECFQVYHWTGTGPSEN